MSDFAQRTHAKAESAKPRRAPTRRTPIAAYGPSPAFNMLGTLHAWAGNGAVSSLLGRGIPLPEATRREFERRFATSFADIRIHDDAHAHASAEGLDANAYTVGSHIVFSRNRYAPHAFEGKRLLAHEIAHVIQQRRGGGVPPLHANAPHEQGADTAASAFAAGSPAVTVQGATGVGIARDAANKKKTPPDFYMVAFWGNRMYYWGIGGVKTPTGWPGDDKLQELWKAVGVPPVRPKQQTVDEDKVAHGREFVEFADRVREFQKRTMGRKDRTANGIIDAETASRLAQARLEAKKGEGAKAGKVAPVSAPAAEVAAPAAKEETKAAAHPMVNFAFSGSTASGTASAGSSLLDVLADPGGKALDYAVGELKTHLVDAVLRGVGLPPTGSRIAMALAEGMGEQVGIELIKNGKGKKLLGHLKDFKAVDIPELYKGYLAGLAEGLVSPVTDLWGLVVFGESMKNMMEDLLVSAFNRAGSLDQEIKELIAEANELYKSLGKFWQDVKANKLKTIAAILSAPQALEERAVSLARDLGRQAGTAIIDGLEDPWRPKKEEKEPDLLRSPAAYVDYLAKKGEDYVIDTPWAKVGLKIGYTIGWVAIQVILLVFTEGIGNAIEKVAEALSKVGKFLGEFSKLAGAAVGKIAEFVEWIGKGATACEKLLGKALEKIVEKLPFLEKILGPVGKFFEKLQKFLRRLFGVVEKDGVLLLEEAGARVAPKIGEELPKPPPKTPKPSAKGKAGAGVVGEGESALESGPKKKGGSVHASETPEKVPLKDEGGAKPAAGGDTGGGKGGAQANVKGEAKTSRPDKTQAKPAQGGDTPAQARGKGGKSQKAAGSGKGSAKDKPPITGKTRKQAKPAKPQAKANNKGQGQARSGAAAGGKGATADAFEARLKALKVPPEKQQAFDEAAKQVRKLAKKDPTAAERMMEGLEDRFAPRAPGKGGVQDIFDEAQGKVYPEKGPSGKHTQSTAADERALHDQDKPSRKRIRQDRNKESEKLGEAGGRELAEQDGIKISDWDTPQQWKGDFGRGIDRIGKRGDKTVILEWKYGGSGLSKAGDGTIQMSNEWVGRKIAELQAVGDTETANALLKAVDEGKLQGAVYKTRPLKAGDQTSRLRSSQLRDKLANENISDAGLISYSRTKVRAAYEKRLAELKAAIQRGDLKGLKNL